MDAQYSQPSHFLSKTQRGPLIAVVNVEISKALQDKIYIYEHDEDEQLAREFMEKHRLPGKALAILVRQIVVSRLSVQAGQRELPEDTDRPGNKRSRDEPQGRAISKLDKQQPTHRTELTEAESRIRLMTQRTDQENQDTQKISIFTRKQQSEKASPSRSSLIRSRSTQVITSRLYNESMVKHDYLRRLQARAQQQLPPQQLVELTHKPKINEISEQLARKRRGSQLPIQQRLNQQGTKLQEKRERTRSQHLKAEQSQCSFKPQLNHITQKLTENRSNVKSRRQLQPDEPCFRPELNKVSMLIMEHRGDFLERSKEFQQAKMMKIKQLYSELKKKESVDVKTGKPLYRPALITQNNVRPRGNKSIGEYLYDLSKDKKVVEQPKHSLQIDRNSQTILRDMQTRRVAWLFSELDSDQDGKISALKVSIDRIPEPILQIIMPILFEMEDFNFELSVDDFQQAIQSLNKSLSSEQKSILYDYKRKNKYDPYEGLTFKPDLEK